MIIIIIFLNNNTTTTIVKLTIGCRLFNDSGARAGPLYSFNVLWSQTMMMMMIRDRCVDGGHYYDSRCHCQFLYLAVFIIFNTNSTTNCLSTVGVVDRTFFVNLDKCKKMHRWLPIWFGKLIHELLPSYLFCTTIQR